MKTDNSIAINITHLHGNMLSRWTNFLTEDGEKEWRQRDDEFETHSYSRRKSCFNYGRKDGRLCLMRWNHCSPATLKKQFTSAANHLSVIDAINRQLTHYAYHVGQIVMLGKIVKGTAWQTLSIPKGQSVTV